MGSGPMWQGEGGTGLDEKQGWGLMWGSIPTLPPMMVGTEGPEWMGEAIFF